MDDSINVIPIRFLGFPGGMDFTSEDCTLDQQTLRVIQNAVINRRGALSHPGGADAPIAVVGSPPSVIAQVHDFVRFYRSPDTIVPTVVDRWVYSYTVGGVSHLNEFNPATLVTNDLGALGDFDPHPLDSFVIQAANRVIATRPEDLPLVWYGTGAATSLGYPDPFSVAVVTTDYAPLTAPPTRPIPTGLDPLLYTASFEDKWGNETNPIPVFSLPIGTDFMMPDRWVRIRVPRSALVGTGMAEADLRFINVWRIGQNNASLRLSNRFVPTIQGAYFESGDFSTTTYDGGYSTSHDNTPDSALPDVFATYSNTAPPRGLLVLIEHVGRIFGAGESLVQSTMIQLGSPARLWFSRPFQYNSWGNTDDGIDDDGGFIDMDDNHYDKILGFASTGSVLVIGRLSSVYTLFGNGFQTFRFDRRSDHGIITRKAICRHLNAVRYISSDFYPYELGNVDSVRIGRSIERYIDSLEDVSRAICFSHDGRFFVSIPQATYGIGKTFMLDERIGNWTLMTEFELNNAQSVEPPTGGKPQLVCAEKRWYLRRHMNPAVHTPIPLEIRTDLIRPLPLGGKCYFKAIRIDGEFTGGPLDVTLTCEQTVKTYTVFAGGFRFLYIDALPLSLTGEWIEIKITGPWESGEIRRIEVDAIPIRKTSDL